MFVWNFNGKVKEELLSVCPWYLQSQLGASCRSSRLDDWVCAGFGTSACEVPGDWRLWAGAQQRLIYLPGSLPGITGSFRAGPHLICFWTPGNWHGSWHVIGAQKMIAGRLIEWGSYRHHHWARQWSATPRWGLGMGEAAENYSGQLIEWSSYYHHHWARQWAATPRWGLGTGVIIHTKMRPRNGWGCRELLHMSPPQDSSPLCVQGPNEWVQSAHFGMIAAAWPSASGQWPAG